MYTTENKFSVVETRMLAQTSAARVNDLLQFAHGESFIQNPPDPQEYGSTASIYRWEESVDGANLYFEMQDMKMNHSGLSLHWDIGRSANRSWLAIVLDGIDKDSNLTSVLLPITTVIVSRLISFF